MRGLSSPVQSGALAVVLATAANAIGGCGNDSGAMGSGGQSGSPDASNEGGDELASARAMVADWLANDTYDGWAHEPAAHPAKSPSPHEPNQIYNNDPLAKSDGASFPVGAASVKELYASDMTTVIGYAVQLKIHPDSEGGRGWYWYQKGGSLSADGIGETSCTGCHAGASTDYVWTLVK